MWIIGGDGWAYDIGFGGLDHVLSSGRNVNILVLDTEVYSNTGGQASKATSRGAVAKFAAAGKASGKKDLGAIARAYGNVYVAEIAIGANDLQATKALLEADAWPGPSLVIAYSTCIAHGIDMATSMSHQKDAVKSGYWPLYRFQPSEAEHGIPFKLDSHEPSMPVADFIATEARFAVLARTHPERAERLLRLAQADVDERWRYYQPARHDGAHRRPRVAGRRRRRRRRRQQRGGLSDARPRHHLSRARPALADRRLRRAADRRPRHGGPPRRRRRRRASCCPRCSRRRSSTSRSSSRRRWKPAPSTSPRRSTTSRPSPTSRAPPDRYLANLERIKARVSVPVIASLNAFSPGGWARYARLLGDAGADAIELNVYRVAADPARNAARGGSTTTSPSSPRCKAAVDVPVALKLSPFYSAMANFAVRAVAGRRRRARPVQPLLPARSRRRHAARSSPASSCRRRGSCACRCAGSPSSDPMLHGRASLAATSGVETGADVAKALLVGADVAMTTSAVLRHGPEHLRRHRGRARGLDGRPRVRVGRPAARLGVVRHGRRPGRLRAGELRAYAALVDVTGHGGRAGRPRPDDSTSISSPGG